MTLSDEVQLGELMAVKTGSVNPSVFPEEAFDLYSIPAYDAGTPDVVQGSQIGSSKQVVCPGDVLLSKIVPHIRRTWVVGEDRGRRLIGSGEWIVFRHKRAYPQYLRHLLKSDEFHQSFMTTVAGVGGSLLRARPASVAMLKVPLPELKKQRRVAAILDQAEALRAKYHQFLTRIDDLADSLFREMFGAKEWPRRPLCSLCTMEVGFPFSSSSFLSPGKGIRLCRGINVLPRRLDWSDSVDVSKSSDIDHDRYSLTVGDIIVAMDRPWIKEGFKLALVEDYDLPALLVQRVARLRPKIASDTVFVYQHLRQPAFQRYCRPTETTIPHISPNEIRAYSVPMPSETLRSDFAERTSRIRHLSKLASTRLANSEKLFAALQHRAFRGEL